MLKIILILIISLILLSVVSIAVNYYLYSWTSFVRPFGCEHKNIRAIYQQERLEQDYDLIQIGNNIKSNPSYKFEFPDTGNPFGENWLEISRMFGNVKYKVRFEKHTNSSKKYTKIEFSNLNFDYSQKITFPNGEKPTTPNRYIENNIYQMIDEMPLSDAQKNELKSKVIIACSPTVKIGF